MLLKLTATISSGPLTKFREENKLNQAEAAEMAGVGVAVWGSIERLQFSRVSWAAIHMVADCIGVPVEAVCPDEMKDNDKRLKREAFIEKKLLTHEARVTTERLTLPDPSCTENGKMIALKDQIEKLLHTLTYREREIIKLRYGIGYDSTHTLEEIGKIFKVTRERVRQTEIKAIRKLQHPLRTEVLEKFIDTD